MKTFFPPFKSGISGAFRLVRSTSVIALMLGFVGLLSAQTQTDPNADIETALTADTVGLQGSYVVLLGLCVSACVVGAIIWALRKGMNPR